MSEVRYRRSAVRGQISGVRYENRHLGFPGTPYAFAHPGCLVLLVLILMLTFESASGSQKKPTKAKPRSSTVKPVDELAKLRQEFITATKDYKAHLEKLRASYARSVEQAENRLKQSKLLFEQGLIARKDLEASERAVAEATAKVNEVTQRMANADAQIAQVLVEADAEKKMGRIKVPRGGMVQTAMYIRYNGGGGWALGDAWKVQRFFLETFKKPLPVTVFGQGSIHERWRLDHRNSMDVSLHPDGAEGQALLSFLRANGIPYLAFRGAIPGTATGPHIHLGKPSHRY